MIRAISIIVFLLAAGWMPQATAITLKIASIAPEGTGWMKDMRAGAAEIKERTNGRVQLKFYGGGVMGTDRQVLLKMRTGQLQGSVFTPSSLTNIYNDIQIYTLPLVFNDLDEVHYVRERMDDDLTRGMEEAGMVTFGLAGGGFALIMSNLPVTALADLKGRKVWIPDGDPVLAETMKSLGLAPVPLPLTDVLTGLQTGLLDIVATPPVGAPSPHRPSSLRAAGAPPRQGRLPARHYIGNTVRVRRSARAPPASRRSPPGKPSVRA